MKLIPLLTAAMLLPLSGCVVSAGNHNNDTVEKQSTAQSQLPHARYTDAIAAASSISFSGDRAAALRTIAAKPDLEEPDQHRIVHILADQGGFSGDNTDVALTLLHNPNLAPSTRTLIGANTPKIASFSGDRERITTALTSVAAAR